MSELLCHLFGDYIIQNHWMATNKIKSSFAAAVHAVTYTLPFLFLTNSPAALAVICGTHFVIDRWRLASYWCSFWGVGCTGSVPYAIREVVAILGPQGPSQFDDTRQSAPDFLRVWLLIIADNTLHLTINHFALAI